MSDPAYSEAPVQYQPDAGGSWKLVLGVTFMLSTLLGVVFYVQYSSTLRYVRDTLEVPVEPLPWDVAELTPTECVDFAMDWTATCTGIKSMCDMYVDRVISLCMRSTDRQLYCSLVIDETSNTRFGHEDCRLRGVQRNVDSEACGGAYRAIGSYCEVLVSNAELNAESETAPAPATAPAAPSAEPTAP